MLKKKSDSLKEIIQIAGGFATGAGVAASGIGSVTCELAINWDNPIM